MNSSDNSQLKNGQLDNGKADLETLEHLLGVIEENRQQRCAEALETASSKVKQILSQTHSRVRERMHRHIAGLRDKQNKRVVTAKARNQTLIRNQQQLADRQLVKLAWPMLLETLLVLWNTPLSRGQWLDAASKRASSILLQPHWRIQHPADLTADERQQLLQIFTSSEAKAVELEATHTIRAGVRIIADGTVVDATLDGLLQQKTQVKSQLIARIKQEVSSHD